MVASEASGVHEDKCTDKMYCQKKYSSEFTLQVVQMKSTPLCHLFCVIS